MIMLQRTPQWEEIVENQEIPALIKKPTYMQLFMFSAVTWNRHLIHYNPEYARRDGLPDVAVHRALIGNFMAQMLTDWIGQSGRVRKLEWNVRASTIPGNIVQCHGRVTKKLVEKGSRTLECEVWVENERGENIAPGTGQIVFFQ